MRHQSYALAVQFTDQVVVVTGAANGIGKALVQRFIQAGAFVVAVDKDEHALHGLLEQQGERCFICSGDITDEVFLKKTTQFISEKWGQCHILINNAGLLLRAPLDHAESVTLWHKTIDVNLTGAYLSSYYLLPLLKAARGSIINVASIHANVAVKNSVAYTTSKGGLKQMTAAMALELGESGIRVNAVAPGLIETAMTTKTIQDPAALQSFLQRVPLGRAGQADDVVSTVCFLASQYASYITGALIPIDGGYLSN